jgi:hypothetical protein
MATPVPYEGAPTLSPRFEPVGSVNVNAPPAAFGVNVAEAVATQGHIIEGAGKELFDRAYAMQELQQHAVANKALADAQDQMNQHYVNYTNLEGQAAVDGYKPFQSDLNKIREDGGANLGPYAQQLYDQESRQARQRLSFSGAVHAAGEQKKYIIGSADASVQSSMKSMEVNPNDPATAEAALKNIRDQVAHRWGDIAGMSPEEVKQKQNDAVNKAVNGRVRALAKEDPIGAQKLLDQAVKDGDLYGDDMTNLTWYVRNQRNTIGARNVAGQAMAESRQGGGPLLRALLQNESGGRNIPQSIVDINTAKGTPAQGYFQIIDPTWRRYADAAGVDLREYPSAITAPYSVQAQVANVIPLNQWGSATIAKMRAAGGRLDLNKTLGENLAANGEGLGSGITPKPTMADVAHRARAIAQEHFPNEPDFADASENDAITQYTKQKQIEKDTEQNNYETIAGGLLTPGQDGKLPTSIDELKASSPDNAAAVDWIMNNEPSKMASVQRQLLANASDRIPFTQERQNAYLKYVGMAGSSDQRQEFLDTDVLSLDLPFQQKSDLLKLQQRVQRQAEEAVPLSRAMMLLTPKLNSMGLTKQQDNDNLNLFKGSLTKVLEDFMGENKRPPKNDEIEKIGSELLQQEATKGWFGTTPSAPWYQQVVENADPKTVEMIRQTFQQKGVEPTDFDINRALIRLEFRDKFEKKVGASPTKPAAVVGAK